MIGGGRRRVIFAGRLVLGCFGLVCDRVDSAGEVGESVARCAVRARWAWDGFLEGLGRFRCLLSGGVAVCLFDHLRIGS